MAWGLAALLALTPALSATLPAQAQTDPASATYTVMFHGNWTTASTPGGVVGGAHFTTLVGAVHNDKVTFWESGVVATPGVENVAELGLTGTFEGEVGRASANASLVKAPAGRGPTGSSTFEIEVSSDRPLFTLLSMIGPSPDWFVGVSGLSLLDDQGQWARALEVDLFPYDAGTENGEEFSLNNPATNPRGTIRRIRGMGKFSDEPMAMLAISCLRGACINQSGVHAERDELPTEPTLFANYPNPFNPETIIRYALPQAGRVRLAAYDLLGREVAVLVDGPRPAGVHTARFAAGDLPGGVYAYRLQAAGRTVARTMTLAK